MPSERYYLPQYLSQGLVTLENQEFHHMVHVMRTRLDDEVEIVNGQGQLAIGRVVEIAKKKATVDVVSIENEEASPKQLILAQAIPQMSHLEFIIEKGTELGMTECWLFPTERSGRKSLTQAQIDRIHAITISALKQCGRLFLPKICLYSSIEAWPAKQTPIFFGDLTPDAPPLLSEWKLCQPTDSVIFCVGPEGGFIAKEIDILREKGALGVSLHRNILRTETAAIAGLSLLSHDFFQMTTPL